jgi:Na+/H+ antiporter NhaC
LHCAESEDTWIEGIKQLLATTLVLILAWGIGSSMTDMGTDTYIASGVSGSIDKRVRRSPRVVCTWGVRDDVRSAISERECPQ